MNSSQLHLPIIFLLLTTYYSCSFVQSIQFTVFIYNELTADLATHCIIEGFDNGVFPIPAKSRDSIPVGFNDPKQSANATCGLSSALLGLHGQFILFDNSRDSQRCVNNRCEWHAKNDGLYFNNQGKQVFQFPWASKK